MLKCFNLAIVAAAMALTTSPVRAQQLEATLQKVDMPGTGFDIVFAMAKPGGINADWRGMPDPLIAYSADGKLAFAIDDKAQELLKDFGVLNYPACTFQATNRHDNSPKPYSVYVVPNRETSATVRMASVNASERGSSMRKKEVPGDALDIVFAMTGSPVTLNEPVNSLAVYSIGSELAMAVDGDVGKMFKEIGYSQLPACAFAVEHKNSNPPQAASVYIFQKSEAAPSLEN